MIPKEGIEEALAVIAAGSKGPAIWCADLNDTEETAVARFLSHYRLAKEVTGSDVIHQVDLDARDGNGAFCMAVTGNGPTSAANARMIAGMLDPVAGWEAALRSVLVLQERLVEHEKRIEILAAEIAEHFPVSITARAMCADEATESDLREVIDVIGNGSQDIRLSHLPTRLIEVIRGR